MQQPQPRPLLGDSVSSTTPPAARRNNPVAVLTHQQLQQLQQLQAHNTTGQPLTFALQQSSNSSQEHNNGSATGNHIVYLNQLNQGGLSHSGTGMGLPPATPTFGVGLNMGLPLSLLNTSLTSLTSNAITTSNPLLNLGLSNINPGLTTLNPNLNALNSGLNTINQNLGSNLTSNNITSGLTGLSQDLSTVNSGLTSINSGLSGINQGLAGLNPNVNSSISGLNPNLNSVNSSVSSLNTLNPSISTNLTTTSIHQGLNHTLNAINNSLSSSTMNSSNSTNFPFQTIQSIQSLAPHIVNSNLTHIPNSNVSHLTSNSSVSSIAHISSCGVTHIPSSSVFTQVSSGPTLCSSNVTHASNITHLTNSGTMHTGVSHTPNSTVQHIPISNDPNSMIGHITSSNASNITTFQPHRQFTQNLNSVLSSAPNTINTSMNAMNNVKSMQSIQNQNISSPGSPFSIPLKSPASNIAPPTPSPSPNRLLLRSPASNSMQSNRNSPSPVSLSTSNTNFGQLQSPMQSPMSVGQIQSPAPSPYPPAKSPHHIGGGGSLNNRSPAPGGSPGPPVVRPNTPILQQGMQVLQIIHGNPQNYQQTSAQLVTRTHLIGNQQIQISTSKPTKQPPQILPKPPTQQTSNTQQKQQRNANTVTSQVQQQQSQPQLVLTGHQTNATTATMIPTAQGPLLLNQVLPSSGPVIVQQPPGGVQLILRTPTNAQQQTHTTQLTQQQLVRVVTAQGMQLQGLAPAFFAVPNGFPPTQHPVLRHTQTSPAPSNTSGNPIVIQNTMVQNPQPQLAQATNANNTNSASSTHAVVDQNLLPPPKKKAKKKKKTKRKEEDPPKLDLASIMKISGIGADDGMYDNDLTNETDSSTQMQIEQTVEQNLGQPIIQVSVCGTSTVNTSSTSNQSNQSSQLLAQLQTPAQNPISGHLRLAVGEDGRVVLHHTPDPNQPEIDAATAQALIRSLTQGGGQNSQIISQLLGQSMGTNNTGQGQNTIHVQSQSQQKFVKSTVPVINQSLHQPQQIVGSPTNCQNVTPSTSPHQVQISQNSNSQTNYNNSAHSVSQIPANVTPHNTTTSQNSNIQISMNVSAQTLSNPSKTMQTLNASLHNHQQSSSNVQIASESSSSKVAMVCPKFKIQTQRILGSTQSTSANHQQTTNVQGRIAVSSLNPSVQSNTKYLQQTGAGIQQKSGQGSHTVQHNAQMVNLHTKNAQSLSQINMPQDAQSAQTSVQTGQGLQAQSMQHLFQQNINTLQANKTSNVQQNLGQQNTNIQQNSTKSMHQSSNVCTQQQSNNILQQSASTGLQQNMDQTMHRNIQNDLHQGITNDANLNMPNNLQRGLSSNMQQNISVESENVSLQQNNCIKQQKIVLSNANSAANSQQNNSQTSSSSGQQNAPDNTQQQKILISNAPCPIEMQQTEPQKTQTSNMNPINSAATSIFNNAPKITPEILNALSNLNPNDQLLIANANGQMQVISQQFLQQFLSGQLNVAQQTQNQTQKIVIGEPHSNNQNNHLQGVQINTPTSQIIVNSSGGAPTIQNNIQNIVVQAAPSQMPQQIQIQNSGFPSQFIDNLNQQQIRNLATNPTGASSVPKKAKVTKKVKIAATLTQNTVFPAAGKSVASSRSTTTTTTSVLNQKTNLPDNTNKSNLYLMSESTNSNKVDLSQSPRNGSLATTTPNSQNLLQSDNGQMVQRVQTIQLPAQKQQMLKSIQAQIKTILARKPNTQAEQAILTKLNRDQTNILASGKIISTTSHPVSNATEQTMSVNVVSMVVPTSQAPSICKNQTSTVQTQTLSNPSTLMTNSSYQNSISSPQSNIQNNVNNAYIANIATPTLTQQNIQTSVSQNVLNHNVHTPECKQHKFYQNQGQQMHNPLGATSSHPFSPLNNVTTSSQNNLQTQIHALQVTTSQSTQCQTDPLDVKPNIQTLSLVKQEMPSPIQIQVQIGSPASQISASSPRISNKCSQQIQSPVNTNATQCQAKQLISPGSNASPLVSPRQGMKRPATSPICRQINRSDLLEQQLKIDQNGAVNPDVKTPFTSKSDACKRLVRYHCFNEQVLSSKDLAKADEIFEETAKHLLSKFNSMMNKYTYLLLMESMREVRTSELMMIDRTFVAEEQSLLNRLREQEAKTNEDLKKEEKLVVPKVEPDLADDVKPMSMPASISVKRELEDDHSEMDEDTKALIKPLNGPSSEYDEWLEIQKELGVYSTGDSSKCKNSGSNSSAVPRLLKGERTRANGEYRGSVVSSSLTLKNSNETGPVTERRWSGAADLERDLLEDTDSLDGLALTSQAQCPPPLSNADDRDDITAQVQSAIDSILNLKQGPQNPLPTPSTPASNSQTNDSKDAALDQAVRSILGS